MNKLWAPWRKAYIRPDKQKKVKGCLFCGLLKKRQDAKNLILERTSHSFAILNLYPYNNGHVMIMPKRHVRNTSKLSDVEKLDFIHLYEKVLAALEKSMRPHGFNTGMNYGRAGGAGVPGHLHFHIVPRWIGDTNFIPVLGETKVISESLNSVYKTLKKALSASQSK